MTNMLRTPLPALPLLLTATAASLAAAAPLAAQSVWSDDRPDARAPVGILGDRGNLPGEISLSYRFGYTARDGNLFDAEPVTPDQILQLWEVSPVRQAQIVHLPEVTVGVADGVTLRAALPLISMEMDHLTEEGEEFSTQSSGLGDLEVGGILRFYDRSGRRAHIVVSLSFPTGSITASDVTAYSSPEATILPYAMQRGTGSIEVNPGFTLVGQSEAVSWGLQFRGTIHLNENQRNYRVGDRIAGTAWLAHAWNEWISTSGRLAGFAWENGRGADPVLFFQQQILPIANSERQGGNRVDLLLGTNIDIPSGFLRGHGFGLELGFPLRQTLQGPQLEMDWSLTAGWQFGFRPFGGEG